MWGTLNGVASRATRLATNILEAAGELTAEEVSWLGGGVCVQTTGSWQMSLLPARDSLSSCTHKRSL